MRQQRLIERGRGARHICALVLRMLGDAVIATPSLMALRRWNPEARITLVLAPHIAPLFDGHPAVDEVVAVPKGRGLAVKSRTMRELRRRRFDLMLNFHGGPTSAWYSVAAGCTRVGMRGYAMSRLYHYRADPRRAWPDRTGQKGAQPLHKVEYRYTICRALGIDTPPGPMHLPVRDAAREAIAARLTSDGLVRGHYAVIQPTATMGPKAWPVERWARVCAHLADRHDLPLVVTTGPGEDHFHERLRRMTPSRVDLHHYAALPLHDQVALAAGARLYAGNDTGPSHIAAAVGTPALVVFGPTPPGVFRPWSVPARAPSVDPWCSPCSFAQRCPRGEGPFPHCIANVTTDQVLAAANSLLAETAERDPEPATADR